MTPLQLVREGGGSGKFIQTIPNPLSCEGQVMITPFSSPSPVLPLCVKAQLLVVERVPL